ncbi:hypothetical protein ABIC47_003695 [Leifsonia sp. 563]|uniref:hypothetical protein n=1 Tax=Leifsonia sp. 563 TaxID=3156412 RepID=UPI0033971AF4
MSLEPHSVEALCGIPVTSKGWKGSFRDLFDLALPAISDRRVTVGEMRRILADQPELIDAWEGFSEDNRSTPAPYLRGTEVGDFDGSYSSVIIHEDRVSACIDFIFRRVVELKLAERDFA